MSFVSRLASQSSTIFSGRLFGAGLTFVVQALIARVWGAEILADYLVAIATVNLLAVFMPLGFQTIGTYFAAEYRAKNERGYLSAFLIRAYGYVLVLAAALLIIVPLGIRFLGQGHTDFARYFYPIAIMAFATAIIAVNGSVLIGLKRPYAGYFADSVFRPIMVIMVFAFCALLISWPLQSFTMMMWGIAIGLLIIAVVHFSIVFRSVRGLTGKLSGAQDQVRRWWRFAAPWVLIGLATDFFFDIDLLLLAGHLTKQELAIFGVCTRVFSLVAFGVAAVYAVTLPDMFELEANKDRAGFLRKVGEANVAASFASIALFVGAALFAPFALGIFGPGFVAGALPLTLLCLALVVRSLFGPASMVLSIHDRPWASIPAVAVGMVALVVGNWVFVPPFGLVGAAVAALVAISLWSFGLWVTALTVAKVDVSIVQFFRARRAGAS